METGQSVKDRAGKWMIWKPRKRARRQPGGPVVEMTAGYYQTGFAGVRRKCVAITS